MAVATGSSVVDAGVVVVVGTSVVVADSMFLRAKSVLQNWGDWKHLKVDHEYFVIINNRAAFSFDVCLMPLIRYQVVLIVVKQ